MVVYGQIYGCLGTLVSICTSVRPNMYARSLQLSALITSKGPTALAVAPRYNTIDSPLLCDGVI